MPIRRARLLSWLLWTSWRGLALVEQGAFIIIEVLPRRRFVIDATM